MKKLLAIMVAIVMLFSVTTGTAFAADPYAEQIKVDVTNNNGILNSGDDNVQKVIDKVDDIDVTADDLSNNAIGDLSNVDETGKAAGKILKYDASGNLVVADDETGTATTSAQEKFTGDSTTVAFVTANAFTANSLVVYLNGLKRERGVDYTENSNTGFTMTIAPKTGWIVEVTYNEA